MDYLITIGIDITEVQKANLEIEALKEKYQLLFDSSPDAYLIMSINKGVIIDCNKAAENMLRGKCS